MEQKRGNHRGVCHVYMPVMWKVKIPSRLHIFLWLLANNKTLTRDNLTNRRKVEDMSCVFCSEPETVAHLFFDCCVARAFWEIISAVIGRQVGSDFESVAQLWLSEKV
jgi:hypothetical protein